MLGNEMKKIYNNSNFMSIKQKQNTKTIFDNYKNLLDILKTALTYIAVFSAITIIFGTLHIFGYLAAGDYLWLMGTIKYTILVSWGIPLSMLFLLHGQ